MSVNAQIKADTREVERLFRGLRGAGDKVVVRALNRVLTSVNSQAVKALSRDLGIKQKSVKRSITKYRASRYKKQAAVLASGRRIPLMDFKARQVRRGVSYTMQGRRKTAKGAFIATMESGHKGVWRRYGQKVEPQRGRYKGTGIKRQKLVELYGPSVPYVFVQTRVQNIMDNTGATRWPIEIERSIKLELRRLR